MKNLTKTKWFIYGTYLLLTLAFLLLGFVLLKSNTTLKTVIKSFFEAAENRTFDYRQSIKIIHKHPLPNKDIVVLEIDDASLEALWDKYGEWPVPRSVYADLVNYIEKDKPTAIIFDLMFLKSLKSSDDADKQFIDTLEKYNNVYVAMNFDNADYDLRTPAQLPNKLQANVKNLSDTKFLSFKNCRKILQELLDSDSVKTASISVMRDDDSILRRIPSFIKYQNNYYPSLAFKIGTDYLSPDIDKQIVIDKNSNLIYNNLNVPLTKDGQAILNWYYNFPETNGISFYKVLNNAQNNTLSADKFKDKFVFVGSTAEALYDIKSVPIDKYYPGVYYQATALNNILDNNFIHKTDKYINIGIIAVVLILVGAIVMFSTSTLFTILSTALFTIGYLFISYYLMELFCLWIPVVLPLIAIIGAFTMSILAKYLMKSKDFEYQYKLATIDGLTELYNHRYFQDVLRKQLDISRRYNQPLSLIIADIDFFKKFNDTYGHQAGDAVLRQVALILKKNSRTTDYVCRYGGEEMSIILPNTTAEDAMMHANRICKAVSAGPFKITPTVNADVTISLGVATAPDNAKSPQDLIEWADKGLYYAKEHGRNQVGRY